MTQTHSNHRGLGAEIARKFAAQGSNIAINYANAEGPAKALASELESAHGVKTAVIQGDATVMDDCARCVKETIAAFGGLDGIIANAGWTRFSDFADLDSMKDDEWNKCFAAQVLGPKRLIQTALPTWKANAEGGFMIITSSIAAQSIGGSSMPYSVTKCAQVHFMKCVAKTQGPKLRINAVLPGLLLTDWGNKFGDERLKTLKDAAALKKEVSLRFLLIERDGADDAVVDCG